MSGQIAKVLNIKGLRHQVTRIKGLEKFILKSLYISFNNFFSLTNSEIIKILNKTLKLDVFKGVMAELPVLPQPSTWRTLQFRRPKSNLEPLKNPIRRLNPACNPTGSQQSSSHLREKYPQP